jgi:methyl-accepting chemotaxis protein
MYAISEQMAKGTDDVASQATMVATASEEMAATSAEIAKNCVISAESSDQANRSTEAGATVVKSTVDTMWQIAERFKSSAATVEELGNCSDRIGEIVNTIEDIADQTNLLALNAAIEAARAGEHGRGFAVVADEVRALAERTTKATKEIARMIKNIQQQTKSAVASMEDGVVNVERGTMEAARSGEVLQDILERMNSVSMQINQIATAAEEQNATTNEISSNMHRITTVVQTTAQEAASQLSLLAEELNGLVGQFKLA